MDLVLRALELNLCCICLPATIEWIWKGSQQQVVDREVVLSSERFHLFVIHWLSTRSRLVDMGGLVQDWYSMQTRFSNSCCGLRLKGKVLRGFKRRHLYGIAWNAAWSGGETHHQSRQSSLFG